MLIGVDYGSKLSGTTVIARLDGEQWQFVQSDKKKDADTFLLNWIKEHQPEQVFLDAPLSLPKVYQNPEQDGDFFYREADRKLGAMSPLFLGGLTARAMRLAQQLRRMGIEVKEAYPGGLARQLNLHTAGYKKEWSTLPHLLAQLNKGLPAPVPVDLIANWHAFDALLAWIIGFRTSKGKNLTFGDPGEGEIFI
jgi:predicted nuclease with RNAse H fold